MRANGEVRFIYALAIRLGKFPAEIMARPVEELRALNAYLDWEAAARKG